MLNSKRVGYSWSDRKSQKINAAELARNFTDRGYEFVQIDLDEDIEQQGPFDAIIHKLSDLLCKCDSDPVAMSRVKAFENFVQRHPEIIVVDSLDNVRKVLDRYRQYKIIEDSELAKEDGVFTPTFVEMTSTDVKENLEKMQAANVRFPFVCKPILAHGTRFAHKMSIIFNENGLKFINPPCVAQTFINHNARLFKLFIIKDKYFVIERPSIKNFKANNNYETVHFDSHDISKPYSSSSLTELDEEDAKWCSITEPDKERLDRIVKVISGELGLYLLGIDVIIENETGRYAIIDMNSFPGYDGVDNFLELYCDIVIQEIEKARERLKVENLKESFVKPSIPAKSWRRREPSLEECETKSEVCNGKKADGVKADKTDKADAYNGTYSTDFDSGIDTSDSCDERKNGKSEVPNKLYKKQHNRWHQQSSSELQSLSESNEKY